MSNHLCSPRNAKPYASFASIIGDGQISISDGESTKSFSNLSIKNMFLAPPPEKSTLPGGRSEAIVVAMYSTEVHIMFSIERPLFLTRTGNISFKNHSMPRLLGGRKSWYSRARSSLRRDSAISPFLARSPSLS